MPIFSNEHLVGTGGAVNRPTGFFENMSQAFEQMWRVDSAVAFEDEIATRWQERLEQLDETRGFTTLRPDFPTISAYADFLETGVVPAPYTDTTANEGFAERGLTVSGMPSNKSLFKNLMEADQAAQAAGLGSFSEVVQEVIQLQQEVEEQSGIVSSTATTGGTIGSFLGGMAGSFTVRDPLNLLTLGFGGTGKTVAGRIVTEMAVAGGVEAVNQYAFVQPNREFAGLPEQNVAGNVALAAAGAGLFQGLGELVGAALARRQLRNFEREQGAFNQRVLDYATANSNLPRGRAALQLIEMDNAFRAASPYGTSEPALRRFTAELAEVENLVSGQTSTAIARVLPELPFEVVAKAADFDIVREQSPVVYGRLEAAQADLVRLNDEIAQVNSSIPELSEAVSRIDEDAGALVRSYETDLDNPQLTARQRADIERKVNTIIESLGEERVGQLMRTADQGQNQTLRNLRSSRRAANKRFKAAYRAVEAERIALQRRAAFLSGKPVDEPTKDLLGNPLYRTDAPVQQLPRMSTQSLDAQASFIGKSTELREPEMERLVVPMADDAEGLDIGLDELVDPNMRYIDMDGRELSFREAMDDLLEDKKLDEAVRSCAL